MKNKLLLVTIVVLLLILNGLCFRLIVDLAKRNTEQGSLLVKYSSERVTSEEMQRIVEQEVAKLPMPEKGEKGDTGERGQDGETKVITEQIVTEKPAEKAKDGKDGKNGRTPIFDVDPDTGDVLMKYEGDTLWNVLIEGCKLTKECE